MRLIGKQIRMMLEAAERLGRPATAREIAREAGLSHVSTNTTKLCRRAESHGLMAGINDSRLVFELNPGWRRLIDREKPAKEKIDQVQHTIRTVPNSVFALGAM